MICSTDLKAFLDLLESSKTEFNIAKDSMVTEEKRTQDLLHAIEFEESVRERNKLCTKLKNSRIERRKSKNIVEELGPIIEFIEDPRNKSTIDAMKQLLGKLRKVEKYHENRIYIPRLKEGE